MKKPSVIRRMYTRHLMFEVVHSIELVYEQKRVYDHEWSKKQLRELLDDLSLLRTQFEKMKDYIIEQHLVVKRVDESDDPLPAHGPDVIYILAIVGNYLNWYETDPVFAETEFRKQRNELQQIYDFEEIRRHFCLLDGDVIDPVKYMELVINHTEKLIELPDQLFMDSEDINQCSAQVRAAASVMYLDCLSYLTNIVNNIL